jgi:hypothetical protein
MNNMILTLNVCHVNVCLFIVDIIRSRQGDQIVKVSDRNGE